MSDTNAPDEDVEAQRLEEPIRGKWDAYVPIGFARNLKRKLDECRGELAHYERAEKELPGEPAWYDPTGYGNSSKSGRYLVSAADYDKLRTIAIAAVARAKKVRAETIEEFVKICLDEAEHIRLNAERLRKFVDSNHEARCRDLCAMYLTEFANAIRALAAKEGKNNG